MAIFTTTRIDAYVSLLDNVDTDVTGSSTTEVSKTSKRILKAKNFNANFCNIVLQYNSTSQTRIKNKKCEQRHRLPVKEALGSIPGLIKLDTVSSTARHACDVSLEFEAVLRRH